MSEILSPKAFKADVSALVAELVKLVHEYEDAHFAAYSPQVVESAQVSQSFDATKNDPVADPDFDPLKDRAFEKSKLRGELRQACEMVKRFRTGTRRRDGSIASPGVEQQVDWLTSALEGSERRHGLRFDLTRNPRSLSPDGSELERLKEAQKRRRERGETA